MSAFGYHKVGCVSAPFCGCADERIAELEAKLAEVERELKRALYPPTFSELAELKQALDPLRVSATETLDNIARRVIREAENMRAERDEVIAKRSVEIARADAAESREKALREGTEAVAVDCELKGDHPPLDPDDEAEVDQRYIYRNIGERIRAALAAWKETPR